MGITSVLLFIFGLIWMFRIEANTAKTSETLARIEKLLEKNTSKEK
ncbi:hypothetical protein KDA06_03055 [Candidatus Saccharibacteria bacterium]|jgi:hypothetical protein|nr:hypothetical protein [Candidatus Saccharibacteria bacterium]HPR09302.1 hypothetical protein [Candidatus Saccharibacteria bacterium]